MTDVTSITFNADGTTIAVVDGPPGTGDSYDLNKVGNANIEIINQRLKPVTVNLESVSGFTTGNIILKSDGTGTGTIIINGDKDNNGNIEITRAETGHSLFKMDTTTPMIDVSIKNVNVTTANDNDFIIGNNRTGGILSVIATDPLSDPGINKNISIENCNVSVPNGNIKIPYVEFQGKNGVIMGCRDIANNGSATVTIKNCNVSVPNGDITIDGENSGGIIGCESIADDTDSNGSIIIQNCHVTATTINFNGDESGGIIGCSEISDDEGSATVTISECTVIATTINLSGDKSGGIMGCGNIVSQGSATVTISECTVTATTINLSGDKSGGIMGCLYIVSSGSATVTISECSVTATTGNIDIEGAYNGGIMGGFSIAEGVGTGTVSISECTVTATIGDIKISSLIDTNSPNGVIMGCVFVANESDSNGTVIITNCSVNAKGNITFDTVCGGIFGCIYVANEPDSNGKVIITNCNVKTRENITFNGDGSGGIMHLTSIKSSGNGIVTISECTVTATTNIIIESFTSGGIMGETSVTNPDGNGTINISDCIITSLKGSIKCTKENSGSIMGYQVVLESKNINISDCCVKFCEEFNFEGLQPIIYTLDVNNSNKEYVIRGNNQSSPFGTINVSNTKIFSLCNFELGGTIQGISPQHLQTTQGGTVRSNSRVILRRTGFSFNPNKPCQLQSGLYKDWNQNPKVPKVSQGERIRFLKLLAKNKNYNDGKL